VTLKAPLRRYGTTAGLQRQRPRRRPRGLQPGARRRRLLVDLGNLPLQLRRSQLRRIEHWLAHLRPPLKLFLLALRLHLPLHQFELRLSYPRRALVRLELRQPRDLVVVRWTVSMFFHHPLLLTIRWMFETTPTHTRPRHPTGLPEQRALDRSQSGQPAKLRGQLGHKRGLARLPRRLALALRVAARSLRKRPTSHVLLLMPLLGLLHDGPPIVQNIADSQRSDQQISSLFAPNSYR